MRDLSAYAKTGIRHEIVLKDVTTSFRSKCISRMSCSNFDTPLILSKEYSLDDRMYKQRKSEPLQRAWASLIDMTFGPNAVVKYLDIVSTSCKGNPILASTLSNVLDPIGPQFTKAKKMKERYQKRQNDFGRY